MKKPIVHFALKCIVIMYFAACTNVERLTLTKTVAPVITNGSWKVSLYMDSNNNQTNNFAGYTFVFNPAGEIKAVKNGTETAGNWSEDNIGKKLTIYFTPGDPTLEKLNVGWSISNVTNTQMDFENKEGANTGRLYLSNQ